MYASGFTTIDWEGSICDAADTADETLRLRSIGSYFCKADSIRDLDLPGNLRIQVAATTQQFAGLEISPCCLEGSAIYEYRFGCNARGAHCFLERNKFRDDGFDWETVGDGPVKLEPNKPFNISVDVVLRDRNHLTINCVVDGVSVLAWTDEVVTDSYSADDIFDTSVELVVAGTDPSEANFDDLVIAAI